MLNPKDVLVTTTSSLDGLEVRQYLKPISAHIVAGTNIFSDFFASFSDVFGGRSQTYQKQISSLYNQAIESLRLSAYEIGANCIIGLNVDLDEISGKGKSMFMLTAIGTAVIIDESLRKSQVISATEKLENISVNRIRFLKRKREIISKALDGSLTLEDENLDFIISNQISEVYEFIWLRLKSNLILGIDNPNYKKTINFLDSLPQERKIDFLYDSIIKENSGELFLIISGIVEELQLFDFNSVNRILEAEEFEKQKRGLRISSYDKPFYTKSDIENFLSLISTIKLKFPERGIRSMKKQMLSSKEKEVWTCTCKASNEIGTFCKSCFRDIYGFTGNEINPPKAISELEEKISLISEYSS